MIRVIKKYTYVSIEDLARVYRERVTSGRGVHHSGHYIRHSPMLCMAVLLSVPPTSLMTYQFTH